MTSMICKACSDLYLDSPGDDTTVAVIHAVKAKHVNIFTGPPQSYDDDAVFNERFYDVTGKEDWSAVEQVQISRPRILKKENCGLH